MHDIDYRMTSRVTPRYDHVRVNAVRAPSVRRRYPSSFIGFSRNPSIFGQLFRANGLIIFINQCVDEVGQGRQLISWQIVNHPMQLFPRQSHVHHLCPYFITPLCSRPRPTQTLDEFSAK